MRWWQTFLSMSFAAILCLVLLLSSTRRGEFSASASPVRRRLLNMGIEMQRTTYKLPFPIEQNLVDWDDLERSVEAKDTPIFWHVLKSGGSAMKLMYAHCYRLVEACETGEVIDRHQQQQEVLAKQQQQLADAEGSGERRQLEQEEKQLSPMEWLQRSINEQWQVWDEPEVPDAQGNLQLHVVEAEDGRKYVNVDVTTQEGIARASRLGFASSGLADIIISPLLRESSELLLDGDKHKGRMFAVFRHPVDRIVSLFYYLRSATWEPTYNAQYASMTLDEYAHSPYCESNWMVRSLLNKMEGPLQPSDITIAKEIIRKKCIVGLLDQMDETIIRFHSYFGFDSNDALNCARENYSVAGSSLTNSHKHPTLNAKGDTWQTIAGKNRLDIILYEYAMELFQEQGEWMKNENILR